LKSFRVLQYLLVGRSDPVRKTEETFHCMEKTRDLIDLVVQSLDGKMASIPTTNFESASKIIPTNGIPSNERRSQKVQEA
jgi:hypothetical protein